MKVQALTLSGEFGVHDPSRITKCDGTYYVYCTGPLCPMRVSTDLVHWKNGPGILSAIPDWAHKMVPKAKADNIWIWAPDVIKVGDKYMVFYSFSTFGSKTSVIGLATSPTLNPASPDYHWTEAGVVVSSNDSNDYNAIDACPLFDVEGNLWLTFGSWNSGGIQIVKLDKQTGKPITGPAFLAGGQSAGPEGSYLCHNRGYYYLFENEGTCCQGVRSTYHIMMGRSKTITGPYLDKDGKELRRGGGSLFMGARGDKVGPGHMGIYSEGKTDWFTYHYYDAKQNGRPTLGIERLSWGRDGWPQAPKYKPPAPDPASGRYAIVSKSSGLALTSPGAQAPDGTAVVLSANTGDALHQWLIDSLGEGYYRITSVANGKVLDLYRCESADGTKIDHYMWLDNSCQRWKIMPASGGGYTIESLGGGGLVTPADGQNVLEYRDRHDGSQVWTLKKL